MDFAGAAMIAFEVVFLAEGFRFEAGFFVAVCLTVDFFATFLTGVVFFGVTVFTVFLTVAAFADVTFFLVSAFLTVAVFGDFFATVFFAVVFFFVVAILTSLLY